MSSSDKNETSENPKDRSFMELFLKHPSDEDESENNEDVLRALRG